MRYPAYPTYKDSGVEWLGDVPKHWEVNRLKHIADIRLSNIDKHTVEGQQPVSLCNYVDVYKNEKITSKIEFMLATASDDQIDRLTLCKEDVIITKDSETPSDIGVSALVVEEILDLVCGYHLALIRPVASSGGFLHYLFKSSFVRAVFEVESNGLTRYGLGKYSIENLKFACSEKSEQQSIANFLDTKTSLIDDLISKKEKQIELLKEKRTAIINKAVTKGLNPDVPMKDSGIEWLGEVPEHWEVKKIKYFADFMGGGTPSKDNLDYWNGSIPWVSPKDMKSEIIFDTEDHITEEGLESSASRLVATGSLLMVVRSGILKHTLPVAINECPVSLNQDMKAVSFDRTMTSKYFYYLVVGNQQKLLFEWRKAGATVESIEQELLSNSAIPIPPIEEQVKIVEFLEKNIIGVLDVVTKLQIQIDKLREYRQTLISAAVTGKIDVREAVNAS